MAQASSRPIPLRFERRFEERLRIALDAMPVAVSWARLEDTTIEFANRKFTELFGYTVRDLPTIGHWLERAYADPRDRERATRAWLAAAGGGSEPREVEPFEVDVRCKDGSARSVLHGGVILPEAGWSLATFVDITERKRAEAALHRESREDPLTHLPNRRAFDETLVRLLARAEREGSPAALLFVDLDGFKAVNDTRGHEVGDAVLRETARRLEACVRPADFVARLGGDEFAVALVGGEASEAAERVADRILAAFDAPMALGGDTLPIGASVGIATDPGGGTDAASLLRAADEALYRAKEAGRGRRSR